MSASVLPPLDVINTTVRWLQQNAVGTRSLFHDADPSVASRAESLLRKSITKGMHLDSILLDISPAKDPPMVCHFLLQYLRTVPHGLVTPEAHHALLEAPSKSDPVSAIRHAVSRDLQVEQRRVMNALFAFLWSICQLSETSPGFVSSAELSTIFGPYVLKSPGKRHEELEGSQSVISMSPVYAVTKEIIDFHPQVFAPCNLHRVKHAFAGQDETELPVKKGCLVEVLKEEPSGWVLAQLHAAEHEVCDPNAKIGWLPGSYLEKVIPTTRIAEKSQRPNDVAHSTQDPYPCSPIHGSPLSSGRTSPYIPPEEPSLPREKVRWKRVQGDRFGGHEGSPAPGESARMGRSQARQHASRGDPELESALVDVTERLPGHARQTYPDGLIRSQSQRSPGVASSPYSKSREMLPQSESKMAHYAGQLGVLAEENQRLLKANVDLREELRRQQLETAKFKGLQSHLEEELKAEKKQVGEDSRSYFALAAADRHLGEELANLRSREKIWEEQFQDWRHTEEKLKIKVNTLEQELSSRNHDLQHYKEMHSDELETLRNRCQELEAQNRQLLAENQQLRKFLDEESQRQSLQSGKPGLYSDDVVRLESENGRLKEYLDTMIQERRNLMQRIEVAESRLERYGDYTRSPGRERKLPVFGSFTSASLMPASFAAQSLVGPGPQEPPHPHPPSTASHSSAFGRAGREISPMRAAGAFSTSHNRGEHPHWDSGPSHAWTSSSVEIGSHPFGSTTRYTSTLSGSNKVDDLNEMERKLRENLRQFEDQSSSSWKGLPALDSDLGLISTQHPPVSPVQDYMFHTTKQQQEQRPAHAPASALSTLPSSSWGVASNSSLNGVSHSGALDTLSGGAAVNSFRDLQRRREQDLRRAVATAEEGSDPGKGVSLPKAPSQHPSASLLTSMSHRIPKPSPQGHSMDMPAGRQGWGVPPHNPSAETRSQQEKSDLLRLHSGTFATSGLEPSAGSSRLFGAGRISSSSSPFVDATSGHAIRVPGRRAPHPF